MAEGMDDSLFGLLRMLCKGLEGQSKSLDKNLSKLRSHMMASSESVPEDLITDIEQDLRILHLERREISQDFLDIGTSWRQNLGRHSLDKAQKERLKDLERDLPQSCNQIYELPAKLKTLLELQFALDNPTDEGDAVDCSEEFKPTLKEVGGEVVLLLSQLNIPVERRTLCRELVDEIESGFDLPSLPDIINRTTQLIEIALGSKSEDFENYLQVLNEQLSEVQNFITSGQDANLESQQERSKADEQVRDSVSSISESVSEATDLGKLKQTVSVQLNQIVGAMDTLKEEEKKRETTLKNSYDALKKRVSAMEADAERVQEFIEDERKKARQDALTGLPNRAAYNDIIHHEIENWRRYSKPLCLVVCDLDYFKKVNDTYGHLAGDKVLTLIGKILRQGSRASDFVTR
ncbi:MAG: GGDEF domain-containing protein, partial [Pseudomonadales bacterium]